MFKDFQEVEQVDGRQLEGQGAAKRRSPAGTLLLGSLLGAPVMSLLGGAALAHHPLGGAVPANFGEGLLSGIGHPILGFDHLAFVIAVGLIAASLTGRIAKFLPLAYLGAMAVGLVLHVAGVMLPAAEWVIALSVIVLGFLVARGRSLRPETLAGLFAVAGLFHGFAFAGAIIGAEATPLLAYIAGLVATQYAIALAAFAVARWIVGKVAEGSAEVNPISPISVRLCGGVVAGIGLTFFLEGLEEAAFGTMEAASLLLTNGLPAFG